MPDATHVEIPAPLLRRVADATDQALAALALLEPVGQEWRRLADVVDLLADDPDGDSAFQDYMERSGLDDLRIVLEALQSLLWTKCECFSGDGPLMAESEWLFQTRQVASRVSARRAALGPPETGLVT